jgi:tetratricopeptide (TPR) repeat protein
MAKDPTPPSKGAAPATAPSSTPTPGKPTWESVVYDKSRVEKWIRGEITLQELNAISGPEMLEMAVIGFNMFEQGRFREARTIFTGLNNLDPREAYYLTALGAVELAEENLDRAEWCFSEAISRNAKELASYVNRGEVFLRKGKLLDAAKDFKTAVDLDPQKKDPLSMRARLLAAAALETIRQARILAAGGPGGTAQGAAPVVKPGTKPAAKGKTTGQKKR